MLFTRAQTCWGGSKHLLLRLWLWYRGKHLFSRSNGVFSVLISLSGSTNHLMHRDRRCHHLFVCISKINASYWLGRVVEKKIEKMYYLSTQENVRDTIFHNGLTLVVINQVINIKLIHTIFDAMHITFPKLHATLVNKRNCPIISKSLAQPSQLCCISSPPSISPNNWLLWLGTRAPIDVHDKMISEVS
mgnify:CR=1 FL=1